MEKIGYKKGILAGLFLCTTGALLFLPASSSSAYEFFLFALFVMACGQSFLEVAANPYVTILGPPASAERRLNFAQSFNAVGAMLSPLVGRAFILTGAEHAPALGGTQLAAFRAAEAGTVKGPYVMIAAIFFLVAVLIQMAHLPDLQEASAARTNGDSQTKWRSLLSQGHLVKGVIAQFFYVGAQVGVASFVIRYAQFSVAGISAKTAAFYLLLHQTGFMFGRFVGSALMKRIAPPRLLSIFAAASLLCVAVALGGSGLVAVSAVVLLGFFHSIMFPTIFALSIKNLGPLTKRGSSLLVMAIIGGAFFPAMMGRISDASSIQRAFAVPLLCYLFILYFGLAGYRPSPVPNKECVPSDNQGAVA
jgi:FHS family L-fucose permease-like MFS transporter